jgi:hypothetical protein
MSAAIGVLIFLVCLTLFAVVFGLLAAETAHAQRQALKSIRERYK